MLCKTMNKNLTFVFLSFLKQELLKSHRRSMSSIGDNEHEAQKRNLTNIKGLWRDAFRTVKTSTTSSSSGSAGGGDETRSVSIEHISFLYTSDD